MNLRPSLYFRMPRVASHSIMRLVQHRSIILPHALSPELVRHSLIQNEVAFRWTFVRNPYTRFVSAYKWAQREKDDGRWPFDGYEMDAVRGMTIEHVSEILPRLCRNGLAIHFYPQSSYLFDGKRQLVDWIGRFEALQADFEYVADFLRVPYELKFGPNVKSESGPVTEVDLDKATLRRVRDFYSDDFDAFGYSKERPRAAAAHRA